MKKLSLCVVVYLITAFTFKSVNASETLPLANAASNESAVLKLYNQIDFTKNDKLSFEVFDKAYHGYMNLRSAGKLNSDKEIITVCDFTQSSTRNRMWIIDLKAKKVLFNNLVAHGMGSGDEFATAFSNNDNSHQSSLGFYVTGDIYFGAHGKQLRLMGMDHGFNDKAYDRGVVVHGAAYVNDATASAQSRIGRSWGCPAVPDYLAGSIINTIQNGTCLFIYYPDSKYLKTAYWLNKKMDNMPGVNPYPMIQVPAAPTKEEVMPTVISTASQNNSVASVK